MPRTCYELSNVISSEYDRKPYPSDVSDGECAFITPYLTLMIENAPQPDYSLREVLQIADGRRAKPLATIFDSLTLQSTSELGDERRMMGKASQGQQNAH